jgi:hypothetical protein
MNIEETPRRGVYFVANDLVYDCAVAFLKSFRCYNPDLPLCLIPFDSYCERVMSLRDQFAFAVFDGEPLLHECDGISEAFHGQRLGHYRKIATWSGIYDEFIYIDIDTVVLKSVKFVFPLLRSFDFIAAYGSVQQYVWRASITSAGFLTEEEVGYSANTGFLASRRGLLSMNYVRSRLASGLALKEHMALDCYEQPFLNFLMVTSERRYTSILALNREGSSTEYPLEAWAGASRCARVVETNRGFLLVDRRTKRRLYSVLFIHWANRWRASGLEAAMEKVFHRLGLAWMLPNPRWLLPWSSLWRRYRFMA